jgi:FtsZ-binding cell division protein ZapB
MESEISQLEARAALLLSDYRQLRSEHGSLRARVDALETENSVLRDKLSQAITRLEALLARLPEQEDA